MVESVGGRMRRGVLIRVSSDDLACLSDKITVLPLNMHVWPMTSIFTQVLTLNLPFEYSQHAPFMPGSDDQRKKASISN